MPRPAAIHEGKAMKTCLTALATLLLAAASTVPLDAQLTVAVEGVTDPSVLGDTVLFDSSGIGQRVTKRVYLKFDPGGQRELTLREVRIKGSSDFSYEIRDVTQLPIQIRNELQMEMFIFYLPTGPGPAEAVVELTLQLDGTGVNPSNTVYSVNVVGRVPAYTLDYALPGQAARPVTAEGSVDFGNRGLSVPTEATLVLSNKGSSPGILRNILLTGGPAYRMVSPPQVPTRIEPGRSISIQLAFTPLRTTEYLGQLTFDFGVLKRRYRLAGIGGDLLTYSLRRRYADGTTGPASDVRSGMSIEFGQGETGIDVTGTNIHQSSQLVRSVSVSGPFAIMEQPALPANLQSRASLTVHVVPKPTATGSTATGSLAIGDAYFPLSVSLPDLPGMSFGQDGESVSPRARVPLTLALDAPYPYDLAGVVSLEFLAEDFEDDPSVRLSTGGRQVAFEIARGTTAATFATGVSEVAFQASKTSGKIIATATVKSPDWGLDLTPAEGVEVRYTIDLPAAPTVKFSRTGGPVGPASQIPLSVSVEQSYPVDIAGVLSVEFVPSDFDTDASVQWSTGGRQVAFEIPSGSTTATFDGGETEATFRTAKAAGEVVVSASLQAVDWDLDLTEDADPEVRFTVEIPALAGVSFSRNAEAVAAAAQIPLTLSIAEAYPTDIVGLLELSFQTRVVASDPSVQWVTGGPNAAFWIPKGSTEAVFYSGNPETNVFQTGTVAGEIMVTARLVSVNEAVPQTIEEALRLETAIEVTPASQPKARFDVLDAAPVLQRVSLGSTNQGRFSVVITGYATSRAVDTLSFAFTGSSSSLLRTPTLESSVAESFQTYYGGNQSRAFGSQFTATVEFMLDEGVFEDIRSVAVSATNASGTSNSVSLGLN